VRHCSGPDGETTLEHAPIRKFCHSPADGVDAFTNDSGARLTCDVVLVSARQRQASTNR